MRRCVVGMVALLIGMSAAATASAGLMVAGHESLEGQFALSLSGGIVKPNGQLGGEPDWNTTSPGSGLDLRYGWNGSADAAFYATSFLAVSLWYGQSDLRMRDQALPTASGMQTFHALARGRTSFTGVHVKAFLPSERSWTPYAFVGVAHWVRRMDLSPQISLVSPALEGSQVKDDCVGYAGGVGFEQPLTRCLGITACGRYFYSGEFKHDLQWMGHDMAVHSWDFWSVDVGLTWHAPMRPVTSVQ